MSINNLVAFVIGAGPNVGSAVAGKLKAEGYKVAIGSRNPLAEEGYLSVKLDAEDRESILTALETVNKELGPVNVIIFNAYSYSPPPKENDVLSFSVDDVSKNVAVAINLFATAKAALPSFRDPVHSAHPKAFIVTGNLFPFHHDIPTVYWSIGVQKTLIARVVGNAATDYAPSGIKFYFASLVSDDGKFPEYAGEFRKSAEVHANVYWDLINAPADGDWDFRFTMDGKRFVPNN